MSFTMQRTKQYFKAVFKALFTLAVPLLPWIKPLNKVSTIIRASSSNTGSNMDHVSFQVFFEQTWISGFSGHLSEQLNEILPRTVICRFAHPGAQCKHFLQITEPSYNAKCWGLIRWYINMSSWKKKEKKIKWKREREKEERRGKKGRTEEIKPAL